jgi:hypothetical protein
MALVQAPVLVHAENFFYLNWEARKIFLNYRQSERPF